MSVLQTIRCSTLHEVENASQRIRTNALRGVGVEFSPCASCNTGPKREKLECGERSGEIVGGVADNPNDPIVCMSCKYREVKAQEPELSTCEFEKRLKSFNGPGVSYLYVYRRPLRRGPPGNNNHHP